METIEFKKENISPLIISKENNNYTDTFKLINNIVIDYDEKGIKEFIYIFNLYHRTKYKYLQKIIDIIEFDKDINILPMQIGKVKIVDNNYSINSIDNLLDILYTKMYNYLNKKIKK